MSSLPDVIGITGSMGAGKSALSRILAQWIPVIDLDRINAGLLEREQPGYEALQAFDQEVFEEGFLDRKKLAGRMFENPDYKKQVEQILHPLIIGQMKDWIASRTESIVAVEAPLLFEAGLEDLFDEIWMVDTRRDIALQRLMEQRGFGREEALARIESQMDPELKAEKSHRVLNNNDDLKSLERQAREALDQLMERRSAIGKSDH